MASALEGLRVLDLTRALAGPYCTLMLGDYGADVIKIEVPGTGDDTRGWGPPYIGDQSAYFLQVNRNKRSMTLNLKDERARDVFMSLAKGADVVVENFTPGVVNRLGIDYEAVRQVNPRMVYCSISGFGQTGPYRERSAYDQVMQGIGGIMSLTGEPGSAPMKMGIALTDIGAGMLAAFAVMSAIFHRQTSQEGQYIDISMLDLQVAWLTYQAGVYFATGNPPAKVWRGPSHAGAISSLQMQRRQVRQRSGRLGAAMAAVLPRHGLGRTDGAPRLRRQLPSGDEPAATSLFATRAFRQAASRVLGGAPLEGWRPLRGNQRHS